MPENQQIWLTGGADKSGKTTVCIALCDHYSSDSQNTTVFDFGNDHKTYARFSSTLDCKIGNLENDLIRLLGFISSQKSKNTIIDLPASISESQCVALKRSAFDSEYSINTAFLTGKSKSSLDFLNLSKSRIIQISDKTIILLNHFLGTNIEFERVRKSNHLAELTDLQIAKIADFPRLFYSVDDIFEEAPDLSPQELFDFGPLTVATATQLSSWLIQTKVALGLPPAPRRERSIK